MTDPKPISVWFHPLEPTAHEPMLVTIECIRKKWSRKYPNYRLRDHEILTWTIYHTLHKLRRDGWVYIGKL